MKFQNCGVNVASIFNGCRNPRICMTAISSLNVQSIVLSNITFENSHGLGIAGINVLGSLTLVNITVAISP